MLKITPKPTPDLVEARVGGTGLYYQKGIKLCFWIANGMNGTTHISIQDAKDLHKALGEFLDYLKEHPCH